MAVDFLLYLGEFGFQEFEVPSEISAGGSQTLAIHKYPGGARTIDAFGGDDHAIAWSGIFTGQDAEYRCQQLDTMRSQGLPLPLTFSAGSWTVAIESFTWKFLRRYQIDYSISLAVIQNQVQVAPEGDDDYDLLFANDLDGAQIDANIMVDAAYSAALAVVQEQVALQAIITAGPVNYLAALGTAIYTSGESALSVVLEQEAIIAGGFAAGGDPALLAGQMTSFIGAAVMMPYAVDATNRLARMGSVVAGIGQ